MPVPWARLIAPGWRLPLASPVAEPLALQDKVMVDLAGSTRDWTSLQAQLRSNGRWNEVLY